MKSQAPSSKLQINLKLQAPNGLAGQPTQARHLGAWSLELLWNLELGIWSFPRLVALLALIATNASAAPALQTRHVLLVMADGVRWQEVFTGAEEQLISKEHGGVTKTNELRKEFWRNTPEAAASQMWSRLRTAPARPKPCRSG